MKVYEGQSQLENGKIFIPIDGISTNCHVVLNPMQFWSPENPPKGFLVYSISEGKGLNVRSTDESDTTRFEWIVRDMDRKD